MTRAPEPGLLIEDYAVVGDTHTMALIGRNGSVDWLCLPAFDSAAAFASLLGDEQNGRWQVCPAGLADGAVLETTRRYRGDSLVLETEWRTATGLVRLTDAMPPRDASADLIRRVECLEGEVQMAMRWVIRFAYGGATPWVRRITDAHGRPALWAVAGPDAVLLRGDVLPEADHRGVDRAHHARFTVAEGDVLDWSLVWAPSHEPLPAPPDVGAGLQQTERFWSEWSARTSYDGPRADLVRRSLVTLKAMTYHPTGGIVAAPTTSLPELMGGSRNWDYRYCWLRDATLVVDALLSCGHTEEAQQWQAWLLRAVAGSPDELQIVYGLKGERMLPELELEHLAGYEGSRPVRIGNAAAEQFQLDVYGEVMAALATARDAGIDGDAFAWAVQRSGLRRLEQVMDEPDFGIWEVRGEKRHFTHSKLMVWVAFDRAVRAVEEHGLEGPVEHWRALRDRVHAEVCDKGWSETCQAFTQSYGSDALDASLLVMPLVGFLPGDDPRVLSTIDAICSTLRTGPLVARYETIEELDGLPPGEGSFLACSFWLVSALALAGRVGEATSLFEELCDLANDVGLLAEEHDGTRMTGNFPQAFSHLALVSAATTLATVAGGSSAAGQGRAGS
ncbi:MAG: glycoside hydrolase family 15 protein [Mycobacteriales bacterium]|nr:glycoside hydrolase family 15 protein [Mycobacteriales bacterium]